MNSIELAKRAYDKYCEAVGGRAWNGDKLPSSEEFFSDPEKEVQTKAWIAAVEEVQECLKFSD